MKRKEFIATGLLGAASIPLLGINLPGSKIITALDLQNFLRTLYKIEEPSCDRIIIGKPDTPIKKVVTIWTPYWKTLKQAKEAGANVLVVHEPTFYNHWDLDGDTDHLEAGEAYEEAIEEKKAWIEENNMVIIRSHDVPDIMKETGIPFALGMALGFTNDDIISKKDYYNVYRIESETAGSLAGRIAKTLKDFGQPGVAFYGDADRKISSLGLGTGCICDPRAYAELGAEMHIAIDDTIRTWIQTTYSEDTGQPLVVINHGTAEDFGMELLSRLLKEKLQVPVEHIRQGCSYRWITA
jgi:putative NIF3 family GTP cyclohydrolase 1 type 2